MPGQAAPAPALPTLDHGTLDLPAEAGWKRLAFHRGLLRCPIRIRALAAIAAAEERLADLGVAVAAISADDEARPRHAADGGTGRAADRPPPAARGLARRVGPVDRRGARGLRGARAARRARPSGPVARRHGVGGMGAVHALRSPLAAILGGVRFAQEKGCPPRGAREGPPAA